MDVDREPERSRFRKTRDKYLIHLIFAFIPSVTALVMRCNRWFRMFSRCRRMMAATGITGLSCGRIAHARADLSGPERAHAQELAPAHRGEVATPDGGLEPEEPRAGEPPIAPRL